MPTGGRLEPFQLAPGLLQVMPDQRQGRGRVPFGGSLEAAHDAPPPVDQERRGQSVQTDVAGELTNLIQTQRAYSSNAKVIQTVDEMLQETTNIKR